MSATSRHKRLEPIRFEDEMLYQHIATHLVFDSLVKGIVRGHYQLDPLHVTLHISGEDAVLFVQDRHANHMAEDPALREWAIEFIARDVFGISPDDVDLIYLDGPVNGEEAYLHIAGRGIFIACGEPRRSKGSYL